MKLELLAEISPWDWPSDAGEMFLNMLRDKEADQSDRLIAAELGGDYTVINDDLAGALLSIVGDHEETVDVRWRAAISLGPVLEVAYLDEFDDPDDVPISESTFNKIQKTLQEVYMGADTPKDVRRRILEASVRAPQDWHASAIREAYSSTDEDWKLTAVFSMSCIRGFKEEILESLESEVEEVHFWAVCAAGEWEVEEAWPHVSKIIASQPVDVPLLLAAIDAVASIRPQEAGMLLMDLTASNNEDVADAASEAMAMAEAFSELEELEEDGDDDFF